MTHGAMSKSKVQPQNGSSVVSDQEVLGWVVPQESSWFASFGYCRKFTCMLSGLIDPPSRSQTCLSCQTSDPSLSCAPTPNQLPPQSCSPVRHQSRRVLWHSMAQHSTAQHSTAQHSTAQHSTAHHSEPCIQVMQCAQS